MAFGEDEGEEEDGLGFAGELGEYMVPSQGLSEHFSSQGGTSDPWDRFMRTSDRSAVSSTKKNRQQQQQQQRTKRNDLLSDPHMDEQQQQQQHHLRHRFSNQQPLLHGSKSAQNNQHGSDGDALKEEARRRDGPYPYFAPLASEKKTKGSSSNNNTNSNSSSSSSNHSLGQTNRPFALAKNTNTTSSGYHPNQKKLTGPMAPFSPVGRLGQHKGSTGGFPPSQPIPIGHGDPDSLHETHGGRDRKSVV